MKNEDVDIKFWLIFVFVIILWAIIRRNDGEYYINKGLVEIGGACLIYFGSEYAFWFFRYYMPHVTVDGFCGSIGKRPYIVGDYAIFPCGEVFQPVHLEGRIHTLVVPKRQIKRAGRNYIALTKVKKTPILQLPENVHRFLYHNQTDFNVKHIFYGEYTEKFIQEQEELPDFTEEIANYRRQVNIRNRMVEGDNDLLIEQMKAARELGEDKKFFGFLKKKKDEGENQ